MFRCEENVILNETGDFIDYFIFRISLSHLILLILNILL